MRYVGRNSHFMTDEFHFMTEEFHFMTEPTSDSHIWTTALRCRAGGHAQLRGRAIFSLDSGFVWPTAYTGSAFREIQQANRSEVFEPHPRDMSEYRILLYN